MYPIDYEAAWKHIQFISDEAIRFLQMPPTELMKHEPKSDLMYTLPQVAGKDGPTIIGAEADSSVLDLCGLYLQNNSNRDRYDLKIVVSEMKKMLMVKVFLAGKDLEDEDLSALLEEFSDNLDDKRVGLAHHIPCITVYDTNPVSFAIGPVTFTLTSRFLEEKEKAISDWEMDHLQEVNTARTKKGMDLFTSRSEGGEISPYLKVNDEFFSGFPWVASVWIEPSHPDISQKRAIRAVQAAIDLLSVATRGDRGRRMRLSYGAIEPSQKAWLSETHEGRLLFSHSTSMQGVSMGDGWHEVLMTNWKWFFVIGGHAIHSLTAAKTPQPLLRRYLDALRWYGEAIRDNDLPSQIAKYSACLERLVISGSSGGVTKKLTKRMALLLKGENSKYPHEELKSDLIKFYELRCEIMHGGDLPSEERLQWGGTYGDYFCAKGLTRGLDLFHGLTTKGKTTDANLGEAFDKLGKNKPL